VPLLSHGTDMHPLEADGETALRLAAYYKRLQITELLLKHSANIYYRNEEDETPVDVALEEGPYEVV
jgi:ankyrin repeat protein